MAILEKEVWVNITGITLKYFEELGYNVPRHVDKQNRLNVKKGTKILVKVEDLPEGSNVELTKICDIDGCGKHIPNQKYCKIISSRIKGDGLDRCFGCAHLFRSINRKNNVPFEKTIENWANTNNKYYLIEEWSSKNNKRINEVSYATHDNYFWECKKCYSKYEMPVNNRTTGGQNCPYCAGKKVNQTNCLWTTHPNVAKLLIDKEMGYKITSNHTKKVLLKCPNCGHTEPKSIITATRVKYSCSRCSDGISYPEKFMISLLNQLEIYYKTQKIFEWSKNIKHENIKLCGNKKYDFYIPSQTIIEVHGIQHYEEGFIDTDSKSLREEQLNDEIKMNCALNNGIKNYIVIDCRKSELKWIKKKILNSEINELFDLSNINWQECHEFALNSSLVKIVCDMWNNGIKSAIKIAEELGMGRATTRKYLKLGAELSLCDYSLEEVKKQSSKNKKGKPKKGKSIIQLSKEDEFINEFSSMKEASNTLNIKLSKISRVCAGKRKTTGGFKWMYKDDYDLKINEILNAN